MIEIFCNKQSKQFINLLTEFGSVTLYETIIICKACCDSCNGDECKNRVIEIKKFFK